MSEPKDGMGGKHLIGLPGSSETTPAYALITLISCSMKGVGAESKTIKVGTGPVAIYRNDDLTTDPPEQQKSVTCDATASARWVHAARLLVYLCEAGKSRSQEGTCEDLACTSTQPLLCFSYYPAGYHQLPAGFF
jgi:hypothetical protein